MEILEPKFKVETAIEELIEKVDAAESIDGDGTQRQRDRKRDMRGHEKTGHGKDGADPEKNKRRRRK